MKIFFAPVKQYEQTKQQYTKENQEAKDKRNTAQGENKKIQNPAPLRETPSRNERQPNRTTAKRQPNRTTDISILIQK